MHYRGASVRLIGSAACLLSAALFMTGCGGKKNADQIVVGEYGSLTGGQSTFGISTLNGVNLAVSEVNAAGGINGKKLVVVHYDDASTPDGASTVAKKLATQDNPTAVIGEVASTRSIAAAPAFRDARIPMISPSSTNPKVTQISPYIFRVCFIDPFQGPMAARFAAQNLHAKTAAILTDANADYSTGLTEVFTDAFKKSGGKIVATSSYQEQDIDYKGQLTQIKAANPDVLYIPGYYDQIGPIAKQAKEVGLKATLIGGDGWDSPKLIEGAGGPGGALEGAYFTNHSSMDNPDPLIQSFVAKYKQAYHDKPDALAALAYDSVGVLADAMKRAGPSADGNYASAAYRSKLRDALAGTTNFKGVTGSITINADRNAVKPLVVLRVKGNGYQYITTMNPT